MITREGTVTITRDGGIVATGFHFEGCASLTVASWELYDWIEKQITQAKLEESRPRPAPCQPLGAGSESDATALAAALDALEWEGGVMEGVAVENGYERAEVLVIAHKRIYALEKQVGALCTVADAARVFLTVDSESDATALAAALDALDGKEGE